MANEQIVVEIALDDGSVRQGFAKIQKEAEDTSGRLKKSLGDLKSIVKYGTLAGVAVAGIFAKKAIDAAKIQEQAVNDLKVSLQRLGQESRLTEFEGFASQLQSVTKFGDEAILSQLSFAQAMGASADQSKDILRAATDMSAALNIDLNSAVRNITKTLGGYAGELGEVIPELKNLSQEQLRSGEGVALLAKMYDGFAKGQVKTFEGAMTQLGNTWGDFMETIGDLVIKSPTMIKIINSISSTFANLSERIKGASGDIFKPAINGLIAYGRAWIDFVLKPMELVYNVTSAIGGIVAEIFKKMFDKISPLLNKIQSFVESIWGKIKEVSAEIVADVEQNGGPFDKIFQFDIANKGQALLDDFSEFINKVDETAKVGGQKVTATTTKLMSKAAEISLDISKTMGDALKGGITQGLSAVGSALAKGENAFEAFGKAVLGMLGDFAIQVGSTLIAMGLGLDQLKASLLTFNGAGAIAAGAALIVLGGALKALSGGMGGIGSAPGPGGAVSAPPAISEPEIVAQPETETRQTSVNINVEGTVLDPVSVGEQIADILNQAFDVKGTRLITT